MMMMLKHHHHSQKNMRGVTQKKYLGWQKNMTLATQSSKKRYPSLVTVTYKNYLQNLKFPTLEYQKHKTDIPQSGHRHENTPIHITCY